MAEKKKRTHFAFQVCIQYIKAESRVLRGREFPQNKLETAVFRSHALHVQKCYVLSLAIEFNYVYASAERLCADPEMISGSLSCHEANSKNNVKSFIFLIYCLSCVRVYFDKKINFVLGEPSDILNFKCLKFKLKLSLFKISISRLNIVIYISFISRIIYNVLKCTITICIIEYCNQSKEQLRSQ